MKRLLLPLLFLATPALAQQPPSPPSPQIQALSQTIMKLTGEGVDLRTQIASDQAQIEALTQKLQAAEKTAAEKKAAPAETKAP